MTSSNSRPSSSGMTPATSRATTSVFRICTNSSRKGVSRSGYFFMVQKPIWKKKGLGRCNFNRLMPVTCSRPFNDSAALRRCRCRPFNGRKEERATRPWPPPTTSAQRLVPWESTPWLCARWQCVPGASRPAALWFHGWTASRRRGRRPPCTTRGSWSSPSRRTSTSGRWTLKDTNHTSGISSNDSLLLRCGTLVYREIVLERKKCKIKKINEVVIFIPVIWTLKLLVFFKSKVKTIITFVFLFFKLNVLFMCDTVCMCEEKFHCGLPVLQKEWLSLFVPPSNPLISALCASNRPKFDTERV